MIGFSPNRLFFIWVTRISADEVAMPDTAPPSLKWVFRRLLSRYGEQPWFPVEDPFALLIGTILSQNTNDKNRDRAFAQLKQTIPITPSSMATADIRTLQKAIRSAGLWRIKATRIRQVARKVLDEYGGDIDQVIRGPLETARSSLLALPGIGYKTTDILLLCYGRHPVIPLDTHCLRVSQRLGYGNGKDYEATRKRLQQPFSNDPRALYQLHIGIITHGRQICHARRPKCIECMLKPKCPSADMYLREAAARAATKANRS